MKTDKMLENQIVKTSRHGKHRPGYWKDYYQKNKERLRVYHRQYYRQKLAKPKKPHSLFQQKQTHLLLKITNKKWLVVKLACKSKKPLKSNWNKRLEYQSYQEILQQGNNVGTCLGKITAYDCYLVCLDFDCKGFIPNSKFFAFISYKKTKNGCHIYGLVRERPGKSCHIYCKGKKVGEYKTSGQVVETGSIHPSGFEYTFHAFGNLFFKKDTNAEIGQLLADNGLELR